MLEASVANAIYVAGQIGGKAREHHEGDAHKQQSLWVCRAWGRVHSAGAPLALRRL